MIKSRRRKSGKWCEECYEMGYVISRGKDFAEASICDCVTDCPECGGDGSVLSKNESGYTYVKACGKCGVLRRNLRLYNLAEIPSRYYNVLQVDTFKPKTESHQRALQYAKEFVQLYPEKKGFLLMGKAGLGKTHLAVGTVSEIILERGVRCMFKDFFHLLSDLKKAYSDGTSENEVLLPLIETEILAIDELGKGKSNEWELNILDQLISKRYNASKTTLVTTNYVSENFAKRDTDERILEAKVGERIASRLYQMCEFIHLSGDDQRKKES